MQCQPKESCQYELTFFLGLRLLPFLFLVPPESPTAPPLILNSYINFFIDFKIGNHIKSGNLNFLQYIYYIRHNSVF